MQWLVWPVVALGWFVRIAPLLLNGPVDHPIDYDQGVYFTAAALLADGHNLYEDFFFAHPPGVAYLLAPITQLAAPDTAFGLSRLLMTVVGAVNILLVSRVAARHLGLVPGLAAGLLYALNPAAVAAERGVFLEPVLILLCLIAAAVWLRTDDSTTTANQGAWVAGVVLGCALVVKVWAVLPLIALLASCRTGRWVGDATRLVAGAALALVAALLPTVVQAPRAFTEQVVLFQLLRPTDGAAATADRVAQLFLDPSSVQALLASDHVIPTLAATAGLALAIVSSYWPRVVRLAVTWYVVTLASFLVSASYYPNYNAFLAPSTALLFAVAVERVTHLVRRVEPRSRTPLRLAAVVATVGGVLVLSARLIPGAQVSGGGVGAVLRPELDGQSVECILSFEPGWLLAAGRLSDPDCVGRLAADPYGAQLQAVVAAGQRPRSAAQSFSAFASEHLVASALDRSDAVLLGPRGAVQIGDERERLERAFVPVRGARDGAPDIWLRQLRPASVD